MAKRYDALVIGTGQPTSGDASTHAGNVVLTVDGLVGPEEVVVRPLPPLLPMFTITMLN